MLNTDLNFEEVVSKISEKLESWLKTLIEYVPNIILAILIMVVTYILGHFIKRVLNRYMQKWGGNPTISRFVTQLIFLGFLILGVMLSLSVLELGKTVTSILAGLGIIGLALGFAFQDTAANFMSGIYITFKQPYAIGDVVKAHGDHFGTVEDINLRVTKIKTFDGPKVYIPNRYLFEESFINYTELGKRRIRIDCGISYGEDLEHVERVALKAMEGVEDRLEDEEVTLFWTGYGDSSINFSINIWFVYNKFERNFIPVRNQAIKKLKSAFDEEGITIPFPIRTLDFGIKGGEKLEAHLNHNEPA